MASDEIKSDDIWPSEYRRVQIRSDPMISDDKRLDEIRSND